MKNLINIIFLIMVSDLVYSQNIVSNGLFDNNGTNWGCGPEVRAVSTYGGTGTNRVAEIDFAAGLCQTINGFVPGNRYQFSMVASRRTPPSSCSAPSNANIVVTVGSDLNSMITRTNSSFGFSKSTLIFTASSSSLVLSIQPGPSFNASRSTCGVIIDSVSILPINVLPIELISFDAIRKNDNIQINWGVASQTNNKVFELEQSNDAKIFKKIKIIEGAGTITDYKLYTVVDTAFYTSNVYYRLKQIDWDGSYTYSEIISVQELQDELIQVITYPNPASELLYLQTTSNDFKVEVFNMEGNLMNVKESDPIHHTIDLSNLQAGFYLIKIVFPEKVIIKKIEHI